MKTIAPVKNIFDNTEIAFKGKSDQELKKTYQLFKLISSPLLNTIGPPITNFALKWGLPIKGIIRNTIFRQFCGGESIEGCLPVMEKLAENHIGTILDFSLEGHENEEVFDQAVTEICRTIEYAVGKDYIPFSVFKVTALAPFSLLEKVSAKETLSDAEHQEWEKVTRRFDRICQLGYRHSQRILIDAEHSWIQDTIDNMVLDAMRRYNREKPIIFTTCQMYLKDGLTILQRFVECGLEENFFVGVKMVRGAYMEIERERAERMGYPSPVHISKEDTDTCYDQGIMMALDHINTVSLMAGTHNENSCLLLMDEMKKRGLSANHRAIWFAQLYGMSDNLSRNLAIRGYNVAKYLPYGPVEVVMPYLFRRAKENTSVAGQAGRELSLVMIEMKRRKR